MSRDITSERRSSRRIVAFLDILGFKQLVRAVEHGQLVEIYRRMLNEAQRESTYPSFPNDHRQWDSDPYYEESEISRVQLMHIVSMSDSIVLYSEDDSAESAWSVIASVIGLLISGFREGTPMRGAITVGDLDDLELEPCHDGGNFTVRLSGLVGQGLVGASELEQACNWSGAILDGALVDHLESIDQHHFEDGIFSGLDHVGVLVKETNVPFKPDCSKSSILGPGRKAYAVAWPRLMNRADREISERDVEDSFSSFDRSLGNEAREKCQNTLAFMSEVLTTEDIFGGNRAL